MSDGDTDAGGSWIAAQLQPRFGARQQAQDHLRGQGYASYAPCYDPGPEVRRNRVVHGAPRQLFPGYVFVLVRVDQSWHPVRSTKGVLEVVRFGESPATLPAACIDDLRARENPLTGLVDLLGPLQSGARVMVTRGVFAGWQGVYEAADDRSRLHVLLDTLGSAVRIIASRGSVEPIAPERPRLR